MPGTTSLGIRYPFQNETVDEVSWQNMANDIDALLTSLQTLQTAALHPMTCSLSSSGTVGVAPGGSVQQTFATEDWDVGGLANLGVSNNRMTLPTGLWYARYSAFASGYTTITLAHWGLFVGGATIIAEQEMDATTTTSISGHVSSLLYISVANTILQGNFIWFGTGTAQLGTASMQVYKLREVADL
jgi:hypothetical protein